MKVVTVLSQIKKGALVLLASMLVGSLGFAWEDAPRTENSTPPKHVVFMIHGLLGDATTFMDADRLLEERYRNSVTGEKQILAKKMAYSTFSNSSEAYVFARETNRDIAKFYHDNHIPLDVGYSLVAHSQGGVVSVKYIYDCVVDNKCINPDKLPTPKNVEYFISFGTPFWGSAKASALKDNIFGLLKGQFNALSFGSVSLTVSRKHLIKIDKDSQEWVNPFPEQLQVINVAGDISENEGFTGLIRRILRGNTLEFDIVVDTSSARMDSFYYRELFEDGGKVVQQGVTKFSDVYVPLILPHLPLLSLEGLAAITEKTKDKHPGWNLLTAVYDNHLAQSHSHAEPGELNLVALMGKDKLLSKNMDNFSVDVKLYMPSGYQRKLPALKKDSLEINADPRVIADKNLGNSLLSTYNQVNDDRNEYPSKHFNTWVHSGLFAPGYSFNVAKDVEPARSLIDYRMPAFRGWEEKRFSLAVAPTYSSYAEVFLVPFLPLPNMGHLKDPARPNNTHDDPNFDGRLTKTFGEFIVGVLPVYDRQHDKAWMEGNWVGNLFRRMGTVVSSRARNTYRVLYASVTKDGSRGTLRTKDFEYSEWDNHKGITWETDQSANFPALKQIFTPGKGTKCFVGYMGEQPISNKYWDEDAHLTEAGKKYVADWKLKNPGKKITADDYPPKSGVHRGRIYKEFGDDKEILTLKPGKKLYVIGRFTSGNAYQSGVTVGGGISERDRYLVTNGAIQSKQDGDESDLWPNKGLAWVNLVDIDIDQKETCDLQDL